MQNVLPHLGTRQGIYSTWFPGAAFSMNFFDKIIDLLLDCSFAMQTSYYLEDGDLWKEHRLVCRRCGKLDQLSLEEATDFWSLNSEDAQC